ncbi:hypothetical protein YB2330_001424 [Saitoella coloradoensis]
MTTIETPTYTSLKIPRPSVAHRPASPSPSYSYIDASTYQHGHRKTPSTPGHVHLLHHARTRLLQTASSAEPRLHRLLAHGVVLDKVIAHINEQAAERERDWFENVVRDAESPTRTQATVTYASKIPSYFDDLEPKFASSRAESSRTSTPVVVHDEDDWDDDSDDEGQAWVEDISAPTTPTEELSPPLSPIAQEHDHDEAFQNMALLTRIPSHSSSNFRSPRSVPNTYLTVPTDYRDDELPPTPPLVSPSLSSDGEDEYYYDDGQERDGQIVDFDFAGLGVPMREIAVQSRKERAVGREVEVDVEGATAA